MAHHCSHYALTPLFFSRIVRPEEADGPQEKLPFISGGFGQAAPSHTSKLSKVPSSVG